MAIDALQMLPPTEAGGSVSLGEGDSMYYRLPDGEIHSGAYGKGGLRRYQYVQSGWKPLDELGRFDWKPYYSDRPHEVLFQRGGAALMPAKQVIEYGYALNPPLVPVCGARLGETGHRGSQKAQSHTAACWAGAKPVEFPQLEGLDVGPHPCEFCERVFPTAVGKRSHSQVMHKDEQASARMSDGLVKGLSEALGGKTAGPSEAEMDMRGELLKLQEENERLRDALRPPTFPCDQCERSFPNAGALGSHKHHNHREADAA